QLHHLPLIRQKRFGVGAAQHSGAGIWNEFSQRRAVRRRDFKPVSDNSARIAFHPSLNPHLAGLLMQEVFAVMDGPAQRLRVAVTTDLAVGASICVAKLGRWPRNCRAAKVGNALCRHGFERVAAALAIKVGVELLINERGELTRLLLRGWFGNVEKPAVLNFVSQNLISTFNLDGSRQHNKTRAFERPSFKLITLFVVKMAF